MNQPDSCARISRPAGVAACVALVALLVPTFPAASAASDDSTCDLGRLAPAALPLPANYHARFDADAHAVLGKIGATLRTRVTQREIDAEYALAATVPQLHVERDEMSLLPVMVLSYQPGQRLAKAARAERKSPEQAARGFLARNKDLFGLNAGDLDSLKVLYATSPEGGATIVKFEQFVDGIQLFDTELAVVMSKNLDVYATGGRVYPDVAAGEGMRNGFALPAEDAIVRALADLTDTHASVVDFEKVAEAYGYDIFDFVPDSTAGAEPLFSRPVRAKRYLFPMGGGEFVPSYYVELWADGRGTGPVFSYVISAVDGTVLFRNNLTQHDTFSYRVFADATGQKRPWDGPTGTVGTPHPTGSPNGYQAPFVSPNDVVVESLLTPSDPWLPAGATVTTGNNCDAYADLASPNGFSGSDVRGATSAAGQFHYTFNSANQPTDATNRQAAIVGMFYQVNWLHDIWYQKGFNEVSRNAQNDNYGRGGSAGDRLLAEGQDYTGTDNANMSTPADGGSPRMQMYKFTAGGNLNPNRDGTFDMLIVAHEMGHYISNRLIGNASGLSNNQGRSMGEGWGDFTCVVTTTQDGDNLDGTYAVGGYTDLYFCGLSFTDNYYYSIRRYPYSARKDKNPLTFKDIGPGITTYPGVSGNPCLSLTGSPSEVHNAGEIWAQMLWECFVALGKAYGLPTGRSKILQYYVDGMKSTPSAPTYTQARDAVIAACNAANADANPLDAQLLWQAFAKRGIGTAAVSPASGSSTHAGVVEDFTAAPGLPDDTFGVVVSGTFNLRNVDFGGSADLVYPYGNPAWRPIMGNWDGGTTVGDVSADHPGVYDGAAGIFYLRNAHSAGAANITFFYGPAGAGWLPIAGDWNGDGTTTIGLYDPATSSFYLRNSNSAGSADAAFPFGAPGAGWLPIAGDWNNDGVDTIGLYNPATGIFYLRNSLSAGNADLVYQFGPGGSFQPLAGDWNSDGTDTVGIYNPSTSFIYLRNSHAGGNADVTVAFGPTGSNTVVAGNFDGQ